VLVVYFSVIRLVTSLPFVSSIIGSSKRDLMPGLTKKTFSLARTGTMPSQQPSRQQTL